MLNTSPTQSNSRDGSTRAARASLFLYIGLTIYVASFVMPAIDIDGKAWEGWIVAWFALAPWQTQGASPLAFFGGLINPLMIAYVYLRLSNVAAKVRRFLALAILVCIPLTWLSLAQMHYGVNFGHIAWIAGILLILLPAADGLIQLPVVKWLGVATLLLLAWIAGEKAVQLRMHPASARDDFFYVVAWNFQYPEVCQKIDSQAIGRDDQSSPGEPTYMQSDCYRNVAAMAHDPSLCEHARVASLESLIGSPFAKAKCRKQRFTTGTALPADGTSFIEIMRNIGYGDAVLSQYLYALSRANSIVHASYRALLDDPAFLARVQAAPSYDEPPSLANIRPANSAEYLYQMVAIDANTLALCRKVSPNAAFQWPHGRDESLRLRCYWDIAINTRDMALCRRLPLLASSPIGDLGTDRESCARMIEVILGPGSNTKIYPEGPVDFPDETLFSESLQQIGYTPPAGVALAATPTPEDYEDFFFAMSRSNGSPEWADFLTRVQAMK
jgi:hypothetical protein